MLDTHYPQITDNKLNDVEISLQEPISKINLRGKSKEFFAKAGKVLSLILPNELIQVHLVKILMQYGSVLMNGWFILKMTMKK